MELNNQHEANGGMTRGTEHGAGDWDSNFHWQHAVDQDWHDAPRRDSGAALHSYLQGIAARVREDGRAIHVFIRDLTWLYPRGGRAQLLLSTSTTQEQELVCLLFEAILVRMGTLSRRSKQSFTSLSDQIQRILRVVLVDGLRMATISLRVAQFLRRVLHAGIVPGHEDIDVEWLLNEAPLLLAMDVCVALGLESIMAHDRLLTITFESELDRTTLVRYCDCFHVTVFRLITMQSPVIDDQMTTLFFHKYFDVFTVSRLIMQTATDDADGWRRLLRGLGQVSQVHWIEFSRSVCERIIEAAKGNACLASNGKDAFILFSALAELATAAALRSDSRELCALLLECVFVDWSAKDAVLCRFWYFASSLLAAFSDADCVRDGRLVALFTALLRRVDCPKAIAAACRGIASFLVGGKGNAIAVDISERDELLCRMIRALLREECNKTRWNLAISLSALIAAGLVPSDPLLYTATRTFWFTLLQPVSHFKTLLHVTQMMIVWSMHEARPLVDSDAECDIVRAAERQIRAFVHDNRDSLEFDHDEDEYDGRLRGALSESVVDTASRVSSLLAHFLERSDWSEGI